MNKKKVKRVEPPKEITEEEYIRRLLDGRG